MTGWESVVAMRTSIFLFMALFAIFGYRRRKSKIGIKLIVAILSGFTFVRGLSLYFGGYPIDSV